MDNSEDRALTEGQKKIAMKYIECDGNKTLVAEKLGVSKAHVGQTLKKSIVIAEVERLRKEMNIDVRLLYSPQWLLGEMMGTYKSIPEGVAVEKILIAAIRGGVADDKEACDIIKAIESGLKGVADLRKEKTAMQKQILDFQKKHAELQKADDSEIIDMSIEEGLEYIRKEARNIAKDLKPNWAN